MGSTKKTVDQSKYDKNGLNHFHSWWMLITEDERRMYGSVSAIIYTIFICMGIYMLYRGNLDYICMSLVYYFNG